MIIAEHIHRHPVSRLEIAVYLRRLPAYCLNLSLDQTLETSLSATALRFAAQIMLLPTYGLPYPCRPDPRVS